MGRGIVAALLFFAGCSLDPVPLDGKACPCAEGWQCDRATTRCVRARADGGTVDAGTVDAASRDALLLDARAIDAPLHDVGARDTGALDAGDPDLLLWLPMDEPPESGVVRDASVHGHDARCAICPTMVAGRLGGALSFAGEAFLRVPHTAALDSEAYTITAWVRARTISDTHRGIVTRAHTPATANDNSVALFHYIAEVVRFETYHGAMGSDSIESSAGVIVLSEWIHLAATIDPSGGKRLYVNGALVVAATTSSLVLDASGFLVGADEDIGAVDGFFAGEIDDVRVYGRVLADAEVAALAAP